jgi:hypothetical protein
VAWRDRMPYLIGHFSHRSPILSGYAPRERRPSLMVRCCFSCTWYICIYDTSFSGDMMYNSTVYFLFSCSTVYVLFSCSTPPERGGLLSCDAILILIYVVYVHVIAVDMYSLFSWSTPPEREGLLFCDATLILIYVVHVHIIDVDIYNVFPILVLCAPRERRPFLL